ncbi:MAG: hypothetical protein ACPGSD_06035 [Flavobacteriales bacterium]
MELNLDIDIKSKPKAIQLTKQYFELQGFNIKVINDSHLEITKGSIFTNMYTFQPLNWKSNLFINIGEEKIELKGNVITTYQMVNANEILVWDKFLLDYKNSIHSNTIKLENLSKSKKLNKKNIPKVILSALLGALIFGCLGGAIAYYTGINGQYLVSSGSTLGALIFMSKQSTKLVD